MRTVRLTHSSASMSDFGILSSVHLLPRLASSQPSVTQRGWFASLGTLSAKGARKMIRREHTRMQATRKTTLTAGNLNRSLRRLLTGKVLPLESRLQNTWKSPGAATRSVIPVLRGRGTLPLGFDGQKAWLIASPRPKGGHAHTRARTHSRTHTHLKNIKLFKSLLGRFSLIIMLN